MPAVDSPILLDFDRCRVLHGEGLVAALNLITGTDARLTAARTPLPHTHVPGDVTGLAAYITSLIPAPVQDPTVLNRILTDAGGNVLVDGRGDVLWS